MLHAENYHNQPMLYEFIQKIKVEHFYWDTMYTTANPLMLFVHVCTQACNLIEQTVFVYTIIMYRKQQAKR